MASADLAELDGVSAGRAHQTLAGAVVAAAAMDALGVDVVELCPWALREGVILRRLDWLGRWLTGLPLRATDRAPGELRVWDAPTAKIGLSTASVYPESAAVALRARRQAGLRRRRGHGLERPGQPGRRRAAAPVRALSGADPRHPRPVPDHHPAGVDDRSRGSSCSRRSSAAELLGAGTVVVHPPFRWQRDYARNFRTGMRRMAEDSEIRFAVENMFPLRLRGREVSAYQPSWDVTADEPYRDYTLDLSHAAVSHSDALAHARRDGRAADPPAPGRRHRRRQGRTPGAGTRHPAVR